MSNQHSVDDQMEAAREVKRRHSFSLLTIPHVFSIGIGKKIVSGADTGSLAIVVSVDRKISVADLPQPERLPSSIEGIPIDVVEATPPVSVPAAPEERTKRRRPVPAGVSIGHYKSNGAGTLGFWMRDGDGDLCLFSNWHVIANRGDCKRGDPILQPAPRDGGRYPDDVIAYLKDWVDLQFLVGTKSLKDAKRRLADLLKSGDPIPTNRLDVARAVAADELFASEEIFELGTPLGDVAEPILGSGVVKSGRRTGVTQGNIKTLDTDVFVGYPAGIALFVEQNVVGNPPIRTFIPPSISEPDYRPVS